MHRAVVLHGLIAAGVRKDLSVVAAAVFVELRRDDDANARGVLHSHEKEISISEAELGHRGVIVEIDLRQRLAIGRNGDGQKSVLRKGQVKVAAFVGRELAAVAATRLASSAITIRPNMPDGRR